MIVPHLSFVHFDLDTFEGFCQLFCRKIFTFRNFEVSVCSSGEALLLMALAGEAVAVVKVQADEIGTEKEMLSPKSFWILRTPYLGHD